MWYSFMKYLIVVIILERVFLIGVSLLSYVKNYSLMIKFYNCYSSYWGVRRLKGRYVKLKILCVFIFKF